MESRVTVRSFLFDNLIVPPVVRLMFFIGSGAMVAAGLFMMWTAFDVWDFGAGKGLLLFSLMVMVTGPLALRCLCEVVIVLFKIHESIRAIEKSVVAKPIEEKAAA